MLRPREREMRAEGSALDLEPKRLVCHFDVVVQQFESRILLDPHPYDASSTKVRECADATEGHDEAAMACRDGRHGRFDGIEPLRRLLAEELERQMKPRLVEPRELGRDVTERRRGIQDVATNVGRDVNRQKEPHAVRWPR